MFFHFYNLALLINKIMSKTDSVGILKRNINTLPLSIDDLEKITLIVEPIITSYLLNYFIRSVCTFKFTQGNINRPCITETVQNYRRAKKYRRIQWDHMVQTEMNRGIERLKENHKHIDFFPCKSSCKYNTKKVYSSRVGWEHFSWRSR